MKKIDNSNEFDLRHNLKKQATNETLEYIDKNMKKSVCFQHSISILFDYALPLIKKDGLILEFGVREGRSTKMFLDLCRVNAGKLLSVDVDDYSS